MKRSRTAALVLWLAVVFLWAPVLVLVAYSFNESRFSAVWSGFTLEWYRRLFSNAETAAALRNTLVVSLSSTVIATVAGTALALGLRLHSARVRNSIELLLYMPIIVPDMVI